MVNPTSILAKIYLFFRGYISPFQSSRYSQREDPQNGYGGASGSVISYTLQVKVENISFLKRTEKNTKKVSPRTLPGQFFFGNLYLRKFFTNPEQISKKFEFFKYKSTITFYARTDFNQTWCGHPPMCQWTSLKFSLSQLKLYGLSLIHI